MESNRTDYRDDEQQNERYSRRYSPDEYDDENRPPRPKEWSLSIRAVLTTAATVAALLGSLIGVISWGIGLYTGLQSRVSALEQSQVSGKDFSQVAQRVTTLELTVPSGLSNRVALLEQSDLNSKNDIQDIKRMITQLLQSSVDSNPDTRRWSK